MKKIFVTFVFLFTFPFAFFVLPATNAWANDHFAHFTEEPVTIGPYYLQGILTMPSKPYETPYHKTSYNYYNYNDYNDESPAVAILIWGTGQVNKDGAYSGTAMLRDLAHGLAQHGIASIRYNKRYYQHPPIPRNMTIQSEILQDATYAITKAYNNPLLGDVYVVGFSLGGILAPTIAQKNAEKVVGLVSLAGSPRPAQEVIATQRYMIAYIAGLRGHEVSPQNVVDAVNIATSLPPAIAPVVMERLMSNTGIDPYYFGFPISYLFSLAAIDNTSVLEQLHIPMLILQGDEDLQISATYDFEAWKHALYGRENVQFIMYQGLNHFFTPHLPQHGFFQGRQRANMHEQVIVDIGEWIRESSGGK